MYINLNPAKLSTFTLNLQTQNLIPHSKQQAKSREKIQFGLNAKLSVSGSTNQSSQYADAQHI